MRIEQEDSGDILIVRPSVGGFIGIYIEECGIGEGCILLGAEEAKELIAGLERALKGNSNTEGK